MPHFLMRAVAILGLGAFVAFAPRAGLSQSNLVVRVLASNLTGDSQSYEPEQIRILKGLKPDIAARRLRRADSIALPPIGFASDAGVSVGD